MNAKEEILELLKTKMFTDKIESMEYYQDLINAIENAIFDVPSEDEMLETLTEEKARKNNFIDLNAYAIGICEARNYILNYKKPETDEK